MFVKDKSVSIVSDVLLSIVSHCYGVENSEKPRTGGVRLCAEGDL